MTRPFLLALLLTACGLSSQTAWAQADAKVVGGTPTAEWPGIDMLVNASAGTSSCTGTGNGIFAVGGRYSGSVDTDGVALETENERAALRARPITKEQ